MKFTRHARLGGAADYRAVFSRPNVSRDACFKVLSRPNEAGVCRLGMAVSRRVCRAATGRNRLKRVIRESFRKHQALLSASACRDIVVLPRTQAVTTSNEELFASLEKHWREVGSFGQEPNPNHGKNN